MNRFQLEKDESFAQRCGEIFSTTKGRISIHCTLCEETYSDFELYQSHLNEIHLSNVKLEIDLLDEIEETWTLSECLDRYLEQEIINFKNEIGERMPIYTNTKAEKCHISKTDKTCVSQTKQKKHREKETPISEPVKKKLQTNIHIPIPTEIRKIAKRTKYKGDHIPDEERKFKCPVCNLGFREKGNLNHHVRRHADQNKKHACDECDKKFYTSKELTSHKGVHTGERPVLCNECGKKFRSNSALGQHIKRHRNQKDYYCQAPGCKKSFYDGSLLKEHMKIHFSERPFACTLCDSTFKRQVALSNHMKLHENKKEFKCELCESEFNQHAGLFSHMKTVHKNV